MEYEFRVCAKCVHGQAETPCEVWAMQYAFNDAQKGNPAVDVILSTLIPRRPGSEKVGKCRMFVKGEK